MSTRTTPVDDTLYDYIVQKTIREPEILRRLREETAAMPNANMQISPDQGQFMAFLVALIGARRCLEIGTFTGYSALSVALALPADGRVVACDISEEFTAVARRYWREAGVAGKIDLHLAPAIETLEKLRAEGAKESFDFAFIDADKTNYKQYYELALGLLRPGGVIVIDNVLWGGAVADSQDDSADTLAIRDFNAALQADSRVGLCLITVGDGLTLARKIG